MKKTVKEQKEILCIDLDNTLIDSDRAHVAAYQYTFKKKKLGFVSSRELTTRFGLPGGVVIREIFPFLKDKEVNDIKKMHDQRVIAGDWKKVRPIAGARQTLEQLRSNWKIALVTNSRPPIIKKLLQGGKLSTELFDIIVGSSPNDHPKPSADEIFHAQHLLELKAEAMVGDSIYDMIAAKRAGIKAIGVLTGHFSSQKLRSYGAWKVIRDIRSLPKIATKRKLHSRHRS